jgi:hypothetical protein
MGFKAIRLIEAFSAQQKVVKQSEMDTNLGRRIPTEISVTAQPSTAGEAITKCLLIDYSELCSKQTGLFKNIGLSQMNL